MIISFRAVGEGHISSITFRRALIDQNNTITVLPSGSYIDEAEIVRNAVYNKKLFFQKAAITQIDISVLKELEEKLDFAFDSELGYLTACPTNVGTGMRASAMLHLPGLVMSEQINKIINSVNKIGLAVRGLHGLIGCVSRAAPLADRDAGRQ